MPFFYIFFEARLQFEPPQPQQMKAFRLLSGGFFVYIYRGMLVSTIIYVWTVVKGIP